MANHRLFYEITMSDATAEEIEELLKDLTFVYDDDDDEIVQQAITQRGCSYVEVQPGVVH